MDNKVTQLPTATTTLPDLHLLTEDNSLRDT